MSDKSMSEILEIVKKLDQCDVVMINAHLDKNQYGFCVAGNRDISVADLHRLVEYVEELKTALAKKARLLNQYQERYL